MTTITQCGHRVAAHYPTTKGWTRLYVEATRELLFTVQAAGGRLGIKTPGDRWAYGTIVKVTLESGFGQGEMPRHFIVTLRDDDGSESREYIRTAA